MSHPRLLGVWALAIAFALLWADVAHSQTCNVPTAQNLVFGDVTSALLASTAADTASGTISYTCSGSRNTAAKICIALGSFNGSNTRTMVAGTNNLTFQIYQDAARSIVWGNQTTPNILTINTTIGSGGTVSGSVTMYGRVLTGQSSAPPGSYAQTLAGAATQRITITTNTALTCGSFTTGAQQFTFSASATVSASCSVTPSNMNFGSQGVLSANVDQVSSISVRCTNTTPYTIALSAGSGTGATVAARKMTFGATSVSYALFRDSGRTQVWGTTTGTDTLGGTGSGATQPLTVYGRVPAQSTPAPATFSDTIVVTATY